MAWRKCSFMEGIKDLRDGFRSSPQYDVLALVWREGGEYNVMPPWMMDSIIPELNSGSLRAVIWITREEMEELCEDASWDMI